MSSIKAQKICACAQESPEKLEKKAAKKSATASSDSGKLQTVKYLDAAVQAVHVLETALRCAYTFAGLGGIVLKVGLVVAVIGAYFVATTKK